MSMLDDVDPDDVLAVPPAPPPKAVQPRNDDPIAALVDDYMGQTTQQAHVLNIQAADANPENAAKAASIAPKVGSPFATVEADPKPYENDLTRQRNALIITNNPNVAQWVADDYAHARIAKDDFDKLDFLSKGLTAVSTGWDTALTSNARARAQAMYETGLGGDEGFKALDARLASNPRLAGTWGALQTASGFAGGLLDSMFRATREAAEGMAAGAVAGAALTPEALGAGAAPGAIAGGAIGFGVGWKTDQSLISAGNSYLATANIRGENGEEIDPAVRHAAAALVFLGSYALNSVGEGVVRESAQSAMTKLVEASIVRPTIAKALKDFGLGLAKSGLEGAAIFGAMEGLNIGTEELAKQLSDGQFETVFNDEKTRDEGVMRLLTAAATGAVMLPVIKGATHGIATLVSDGLRARQAENDAAALKNLMGAAENSKTRERSMSAFQRFVSMHTSGTPVEDVYIPGDRLRELYQSLGVEPGADDLVFGKFVPDIKEQLEQTAETGGDVVVPLSGFITHLAGSDIARAVENDMRMRPEGMTMREAETYAAERGRLLEENAVDYQFSIQNALENEDSVQKVYDDAFSKLRNAGNTIDVSTQYATLLAARYRTRAERLGGEADAHDLYKAEGLEIRRELPPMLRKVNVDYRDMLIESLRRGDTLPSDRALFGPTVLEFIRKNGGINDTGGELKAMDFGKKGMPSGILRPKSAKGRKADNSLDEFGLRLWEAGYFPGDQRPTPQDVLDAIGEELHGNKRYQIGTDREAEAMFKDAVSGLSDFLARHEIDVKSATNAQIKRALTRFEKEAQGETFNQIPPEVVKQLGIEKKMPADVGFARAVENTKGAKLTDDGLLISLTRWQLEDQGGDASVRTGVFYLPEGSPNLKHYKSGKNGYGGDIKMTGETLLRAPLFVKGATGGKAPEAAYDKIKGKGAAKKLVTDIFSTINGDHFLRKKDPELFTEQVSKLLEKYGAEGDQAYHIIRNSQKGNQLRYALQENIIAHAVREAGHDSVVGGGVGRGANKGEPFITEVFDVREDRYPSEGGGYSIHEKFNPEGKDFYQGSTRDVLAQPRDYARKVIAVEPKRGESRDDAIERTWVEFEKKYPNAVRIKEQGVEPGRVAYVRAHVPLADLPAGERPNAPAEQKTLYQGAESQFKKVVAPKENVERVIDSNFTGPVRQANETRNISDLQGSMSASAGDSKRADALAKQIGGQDGYFERIIVNGRTGEVIEGQHRLAAAARLGKTQIPVLALYDATHGFPIDEMRSAILGSKKMPSDNVTQMINRIAEAASDVGVANVRAEYEAPKGFEGAWNAALSVLEARPPEFKQQSRGKITLGDGKAVISLFKDADLSTFLHETGHLWLEEMRRDYLAVAGADKNAEGIAAGSTIRADFETILQWMKVETPADIGVEQHEQFARAFEAYLLEGKAPSTALMRAFKSFKQWLVRIYQTVAGLNTPINDEIRGVFDRMIASDEEIAAAREREGLNPVFASAEDAGMTKAEFAAYTRGIERAQQSADKELLDKTMKTTRERRTKEWQDELEIVTREVAPVVASQPRLRAESWLRTGRMLDGAEIKGVTHARLSKADLVAMYGHDGMTAMLPRGVVTDKQGLHPDDAAALFGYRNGDDLVKDLMSLEATRKATEAATGKKLGGVKYATHLIDEAANEKMLERHGDALNDGSIEEEAIRAVHNKAQAEVMAIELRSLARKLSRTPLSLADIKAWVGEQIGAMKIPRATNNAAFLRHEGAAGRDVQRALLKGDIRTAFILKQRQLINHLMVGAANDAKADYDSALKMFSRYATKSKFAALEQPYVDQLHAILKRMGYPTGRQDAELQSGLAGKSLREFVNDKLADGFELIVPDFLLDQTWAKTPKNLTLDELRGVQDAFTTMIHAARMERTATIDGKRQEFAVLRDEALDQLSKLPLLPDASLTKDKTAIRSPSVSVGRFDALRARAFNFKTALRQGASALRKIEELVDILDEAVGAKGVFNRLVFKPMADAQAAANDLRIEITKKWLALRDSQSQAWKDKLGGKRVTTPELRRKDGTPWDFSKSELLMIALNTGNESNFSKMLKGELWDESALRTVLDRHLTEEDWKFVQSTWDIVNSLWPRIEEMQRRLTGLGPDKVEARVVDTKFGQFPGGYFPIMYDARLSPDVEARARLNASKLFDEDYQSASTPKGHTKRRVEDFARPLDYTFGRVASHLESVIHDLTHREAIMQANKVMADKEIRSAVVATIGKENYDQFMPWLKHLANEKAIDQRGLQFMDNLAKRVRINTTCVGLGFRMSTMFMQLAGYSDSAEMIGARNVGAGFVKAFGFKSPLEAISATLRGVSATKAGKKIGAQYLAQGFDAIAGHPRKFQAAREFVMERSGEMRHRMDNLDRDIKAGLEELIGKKGFMNEVRRFAYYGIGMMDQAVVIPTWLGAHAKAMAEGKSEAEANYYADKVVRLSQGAGGAKDLAAVQRSHNEWFKLVTMFYSYLSHLLNRQFSVVRQAKSGVAAVKAGNYKAARQDFAAVAARSWWLLVVPALATPLLAGRGPSEGQDWATWALQRTFFNLWGGVPIVRDVANMIDQKTTGKYKGGDFKLTPAERMVDTFGKTGADIWNATFGDQPVSDKWLRHAIETSGYLGGVPGAGQIGQTTQYLWDVADGQEKPDNAGEFVGAVLLGPPKKD